MQIYIAFSTVILAWILSLAIYKTNCKGHRWLSLFLLLYGSHVLLRFGLYIENEIIVVYLPIILFPATFFMASAILLYTNQVLFDKNNQKILYHLIMPILSSLVHISLFFIVPDEMNIEFVKNQKGIHHIYTIILSIILIIYNLFLVSTSYSRIVKYKKQGMDYYSNDVEKNTRWLTFFVLAALTSLLLFFIVIIFHAVKNLGVPFTIVEDLWVLLILLYFIYYLITKPEILPLIKDEEDEDKKSNQKYAKVNLPDDIRKKYVEDLENHMIKNQAYLDEKLSIIQLSKELDIPAHHLSMTINIEFKQNFYNYVNNHRLKHVINLLKNPQFKDETMISIAFQSGFQSKTSFNKAFKSIYGKTPTEYRKAHC